MTGRTRVYGYVLLALWASLPEAPSLVLAAGPALDCAHPAEARAYIALLRLAEIEGAEDIHRAAMWEAFGHCPGGNGGAPCRSSQRRRFEEQWQAKRRAIEDKYRELQTDFELRCVETISSSGRGVRAAS